MRGPVEWLPVYLDMRHVCYTKGGGIDPDARFPGISAFLHQHGLDLARDPIPVRPAAHYLMGGVRTDVDGQTSLRGLYAAGEVACTGVHGANRLASNSLLEGLVFGARAAESMRRESASRRCQPLERWHRCRRVASLAAPVEEAILRLQQQMWEHAGLLRDAELLKTIDLSAAADYAESAPSAQWTRREYEARSLARVARAIVRCALAREESRGAHFRNDFPQRDDARFGIALAPCRGCGELRTAASRRKTRRTYSGSRRGATLEDGGRAGISREAAAKIATVPRMTSSDQSVGISNQRAAIILPPIKARMAARP